MTPSDLLYTATHEWVRLESGLAVVGVTHFAQEQLGDLTFVELPAEGDAIKAGDEMGSVESVKAASELYSPVTGRVAAVNQDLENEPGLVNEDPYGRGWMIKVEIEGAPEGLLSPEEYKANIEK